MSGAEPGLTSRARPVTTSSRPVVVVALVTALSLVGDSMLYIVLPLYWQSAGLDGLWQVGVLLSVNRLVRLPLNPLVGALYQRVAPRTGLIVAVLLGALTTAGYGLAEGFTAWLALRILWGLAWSLFRIGGLTAVVQAAPGNGRGRLMGLYNGLYRLGSLVGMLLGGWLVPVLGLPALALGFAVLSLCGLPLLMLHVQTAAPEAPGVNTRLPLQASSEDERWARWVVVSGFIIAMLVQGVIAATLAVVIHQHFGLRFDLFGVLLSATGAAGALQALRWAWEPLLASRIGAWSDGPGGRVPLQVAALGAAALCFVLLTLPLPLSAWLMVALGLMLVCTALTTLNDALAADLARHGEVVRTLTRYAIAQDLGAAAGPFLGLALLGLSSGRYALYGASALLLLSCAAGLRRFNPGAAR